MSIAEKKHTHTFLVFQTIIRSEASKSHFQIEIIFLTSIRKRSLFVRWLSKGNILTSGYQSSNCQLHILGHLMTLFLLNTVVFGK